MSDEIQIIKRDYAGNEVFRYPGKVVARNDQYIRVEAYFTFEAVQVEEIVLRLGDRFIETYYFDRWYNIFEIHSRQDDSLKAYYCNIGRPAVAVDGEISYQDLALDLLVRPDGRETVLDIDEFEELPLDEATRQRALSGLAGVQQEVRALLHPEG